MTCFVGLDVSLNETSLCVVDAAGIVLRGAEVPSDPHAIASPLGRLGQDVTRAGLEAGPLSQWLHAGLTERGTRVVCLETRHTKAALGP